MELLLLWFAGRSVSELLTARLHFPRRSVPNFTGSYFIASCCCRLRTSLIRMARSRWWERRSRVRRQRLDCSVPCIHTLPWHQVMSACRKKLTQSRPEVAQIFVLQSVFWSWLSSSSGSLKSDAHHDARFESQGSLSGICGGAVAGFSSNNFRVSWQSYIIPPMLYVRLSQWDCPVDTMSPYWAYLRLHPLWLSWN